MQEYEGDVIYQQDFIRQLMEKYHYSKKSAKDLTDDFLNLVVENIEKGNTLFFYGYGKLTPVRRKGWTVRSPLFAEEGESKEIPDRFALRFIAGSKLKIALRKWLASREQTEVGDD